MSHDSPPDGGRQGQADAWSAFSLVLSGVLVWGGAGWLVSEWLDNSAFLMLGLLVGTGAALYIVWFRYGRT
jgi:ATP synthase protein I